MHSQRVNGVFIQAILYTSIICLLNTLFFSINQGAKDTIQAPGKAQAHISKAAYKDSPRQKMVKRKMAKSLLRFAIEKLSATTENTSKSKEGIQEQVYKVEYIAQKNVCLFPIIHLIRLPAIPLAQPFFINPFLERYTPPPRV
ncbi:hypothetical protein Q0590_30560 [Rhodocytophaga aerolata]|uniref:Uncharacterized protein n=1 Tax=Rhodocytophaga aerolata TaxID=455078 RepID=A0ABT8RIM6_9BACT|nr:hypothetical protein [Rhodocytophaga aerolata]MDO1450655.1 hypothetical protein [Rhodocytophaga aerolata]